jgi:hypothetical protein
MVVKFVQRVLPAASAKFGSVIGCVVAMRPASAFGGSVHGLGVRDAPIPHHQILLSACTLARV